MDELTGILKGADDYITKPFNPPILLARIGVVLKRTTDKNAEKSRGNALNMEYKGSNPKCCGRLHRALKAKKDRSYEKMS